MSPIWSPSRWPRRCAEWPHAGTALVAPIDPDLADTAAFCERYERCRSRTRPTASSSPAGAAGETRYAACVILATTRADVNNVVRRRIDTRKASFAPMDDAVELTGMEYGGITPIGLPAEWPILIDAAVLARDVVVIGSGLRRSKIALPAAPAGRPARPPR